jgi:predicted negative regulator of RcsB-dependent stress response
MSTKTNQPKSKPVTPVAPEVIDETIVDLEQVTGGAVHWVEANQKPILFGILGLAALIGGYFWYNNYKSKQNDKGYAAVVRAEQRFEQDSFAAALSNPGGGFSGLTDVASKFSSSDAGNAAQYQAAVSYLNLGKFDEAIKAMDAFSASGEVAPTMKNGILGDAWSEKKDFKKALSFYKQAGASGGVDDLKAYYLKKAGLLSEVQKDYSGAVSIYKEIKNNYAATSDGNGIDKFILRAEAAASAKK